MAFEAKMPVAQSSSSSASPVPSPAAASRPSRPKSQGDRPASPRVTQSQQERINDILETGLERAERTRSEPTSPPPQQQQQYTSDTRRMEPLLGRGDGGSSSEDDQNPAGSRSRRDKKSAPPNYQGTAIGGGGGGGTGLDGSVHRRSVAGRSARTPSPQPRTTAQDDGAPNGSAHGDRGGDGILATLKNTFGSVELENKGSVARDHLALERTFLAWLRTSVSFASIGIAVTQLFRLSTSLSDGDERGPSSESQEQLRQLGKPLGAAFLGISILILFLGYGRFVRGQRWIMSSRFPASRGTVILVTLLTLAAMVASLAIVLAFSPGGVD